MSDRLLAEVAERAGSKLVKVRIQSASQVTDQGLAALTAKLSKVQSFMVEDVSKAPNPGMLHHHHAIYISTQHILRSLLVQL